MKHRFYLLSTLMLMTFFSCQEKAAPEISETPEKIAEVKKQGTIMQIVKLKTELSDEEFYKIAREREPQFEANPGIIQKYYIKIGPGEYGGVYIWDTKESLEEFKKSELAATIATAYKGIEKPSVEIVDLLFQLRE